MDRLIMNGFLCPKRNVNNTESLGKNQYNMIEVWNHECKLLRKYI